MQLSKIKKMFKLHANKFVSGLIVSAMVFSSVPTCVLAQDEEESLEPTVIESTVATTTEETTISTTVAETTTAETVEENVDNNVTSIPTDETTPTSDVTEEAEEPPIETTEPSTETVEPTETTIESTDPIESSVTSSEPTEEVPTVIPEEKENKITVAKSYDDYFELIAKLPDGVQRIIVDTDADLSSLEVSAGVYYDGTYILVFDSQDSYNAAISYITNKNYTYAIDGTLSICDNTGNTTVATGKLNPNAKVKVAVIDTGSNNANEYYSVINEDTTDRNGHGTKMCNYILSETNDAYLISIKALNKDGDGQMSDVYAAVQMAEDLGVDYILMSISIRDNGKYEAFKDLIKNTKAKVVASAGNNGTNAKKYLPAGIDNVITVGAVRADSYIVSTSNYGECVNYYAPASSTSIAAAKVVGKIIANAYDLQTIAFMLDGDTYYLEGSEYHFSTDDYRFRHGAYTLLSASDLQYGDFNERMLQYCTDDNLSDANASYSYGLNAAGGAGFHANNNSKTYEPGGCIQFVMSATAWTARNNENAKFWTTGSDVHGYIDKSTGCSTFMRNAGFTANPSNYGADLDSAWNGTSSNYDKAIATNNQLYRYLRDYAKPGDIIMFGATWDSSTPWHHVAIYAGPAYYETSTGDLPHPETYDDHWRYEYYFGGDSYPDNCYSCSIFYEATQSWPGYRAHMRIIGPSDFYSTRGAKDFDTVVILRGENAPTTTQLTVQKHSSDTSISNSSNSYSLEGSTYVLYDGNTAVATFVMNANGTTSTTYTTAYNKTYTLKETVAGRGYKLDSTTYTVTVGNTGIISISSGATVDNSGTIKILSMSDVPATVGFTMTKVVTSGYTNITNGNSCYSLDNTTYKVYASDADAVADRNAIGTIVFNANGTPKSNTVPNTLKLGVSYFIKETQAGKGMELDETIYRVRADAVNNAVYATKESGSYGTDRPLSISNSTMQLTVSDAPGTDPITIQLRKTDASGQPVNGATMNGAQFRLSYYAQDLGTGAAPATPTCEYVITLNGTSNQTIRLSTLQSLTASGGTNPNYLKNLGTTTGEFPYGTIRLEEITAPTGYNRNTQVVRIRLLPDDEIITNEGTGQEVRNRWNHTVSGDDINLVLDEVPEYAFYSLTKNVNIDTISKVGYQFELYNVSANPAILMATGTSQADGRVLWTYKYAGTDGNGYMSLTSTTATNLTNTTTYTVELPIGPSNNRIKYEVRELDRTVSYQGVPFTLEAPTYNGSSTVSRGTNYYSVQETFTTNKSTTSRAITNRYESIGATVRKVDAFSGSAKTYYFHLDWLGNGTSANESSRKTVESFTLTTNADGVASKTFQYLPLGWYEVVEVDANGNKLPAHSSTMDVAYENSPFYARANGADYVSTVINTKPASIGTTLVDSTTNAHVAVVSTSTQLVDTISYEGLYSGTYYVSGVLMDRATGEEVKINGQSVVATGTFTLNAITDAYGYEKQQSGVTTVTFNIDATKLAGTTVVAYETLRKTNATGEIVAEHKDINDAFQTVYIPSIGTTLTDNVSKTHIATIGDAVVITDTVAYTNLLPGVEYKMSGVLMNKVTGESTGITGSQTFTPTSANGTVQVKYTLNRSQIDDVILVAFETLTYNNITITEHKDITDTNQTIYLPKLKTTLTGSLGSNHVVGQGTHFELTDKVVYSNAAPNTAYTVNGIIMVKETNQPLLDASGNQITASATFMSNASGNGTVGVFFDFDANITEDMTLVCYEYMMYQVNSTTSVTVATHEDINDVDQSVMIPAISTQFYDKDLTTDKDTARSLSDITLVDTINYKNLVPGVTYEFVSTVMIKGTTPTVLTDKSGNPVTKTTSFKATQADGSIDVEFEHIDATVLEGQTLVAFETLKIGGAILAVHEDINDVEQTVKIPKIRTQLVSKDTTDSVVPTNDEVELIDTVTYENLVVGKTYTITGKLVFADGSGDVPNVTVTPATFTADSANGTAEVKFKFNSNVLKNKTLVAFEDLLIGEVKVASHADITDENQTVYIPEIHTTLLDQATDKHVSAEGTVTVIDSVACNNLVVGKEYTLDGTLMNKKTGDALKDASGNPITATLTWTAEAKDETRKLTFTFDSSLLEDGTGAIVAFESLKHNNIEITTHNDLTDFDQSVYVPSVYTELFDEKFTDDEDMKALTRNFTSVNLVDKVYLKNLTPGYTYTIYSGLYIREESDGINNTPFCNADGEQYVQTLTFDPEDDTIAKNITIDPDTGAISCMIEVKYTIDATLLSGKHIVAFESLDIAGSAGSVSLVSHADPKNDFETVSIPEIGTTATDKADGDKMLDGTKTTQTVVDTIAYTGLVPNVEYVATGKLVVKKDYAEGEEFEYVTDKDGNVLEVSVPFTPDANNSTIDAETGAASGTVTVEFTFDASKYAGKYLVAFETLTYKGIEIAVHADITDEGQTVKVPLLLHVKIAKMDGKNVKYTLKNAEITIYRALLDAEGKPTVDESGNVIYEVVKDVNDKECIGVTDKDGVLEFTVMYDEHYAYYAKETKAPRGYYINDKYFEITPTDSRESEGICLIPVQIVDFAIPPRTGDSMNLGLYITLTMLSAIGVCGGLYFIHKKKKSEDIG